MTEITVVVMTEITGIKLSLVSVPLDGLDANTPQASKIIRHHTRMSFSSNSRRYTIIFSRSCVGNAVGRQVQCLKFPRVNGGSSIAHQGS